MVLTNHKFWTQWSYEFGCTNLDVLTNFGLTNFKNVGLKRTLSYTLVHCTIRVGNQMRFSRSQFENNRRHNFRHHIFFHLLVTNFHLLVTNRPLPKYPILATNYF